MDDYNVYCLVLFESHLYDTHGHSILQTDGWLRREMYYLQLLLEVNDQRLATTGLGRATNFIYPDPPLLKEGRS
jgi:hypothetical protein